MKLHRTNKQAEWLLTPASKRNIWQKLSFATKGIITPGNLVTFAGLILVFIGLLAIVDGYYLSGTLLLLLGRLFDIFDGWVADKTGTKSPIGEAADAIADKIVTGLSILIFFSEAIAAWWLLVILMLPQIVSALISFIARQQNKTLHPSRIGKLSMFFTWAALLALLLRKTIDGEIVSFIHVLAYILTAVATVLGIMAVWGYAKLLDRLVFKS
jgi:phosphatidylglycerophosphate synthase